MSGEWTVVDTARDNEREVDSRGEAEEKKNDMVSLGADPGDLEIRPPDGEAQSEPEPEADGGPEVAEPEPEELPEQDDVSVQDDPVDWLPGHFIDTIQGVPTVNRKGYAVIASKYGISVEAEPVTLPSETGFEHAEFRAVAETPDGETYTGFGSAHVSRQDGDDQYLLAELAETRAMKRAVAWASGVGLTAVSELKAEL